MLPRPSSSSSVYCLSLDTSLHTHARPCRHAHMHCTYVLPRRSAFTLPAALCGGLLTPRSRSHAATRQQTTNATPSVADCRRPEANDGKKCSINALRRHLEQEQPHINLVHTRVWQRSQMAANDANLSFGRRIWEWLEALKCFYWGSPAPSNKIVSFWLYIMYKFVQGSRNSVHIQKYK